MNGATNRVAIIGGCRTPFVKAATVFKHHPPLSLAVHSLDGLLDKQQLDPSSVEELAYGIVVMDARLPHFAREVVFSSQLPPAVEALTLSNNCITGLSAMVSIADSIAYGRIEVGVAGGVESMSNPAVLFGKRASRVLLDVGTARGVGERLRHLLRLRPSHFKPAIPAVAEPSTGLTMGQHTEIMVKEWQISRKEQDEIAYRSHKNAHRATEDGRLLQEISPLDGVDRDLIVRADTSMEKLAKLPPVFDRSAVGTISAGNSSPLTDGAAAVLLMSEDCAKKESRQVLALLRDFEFAALDPKDGLLMAPALAVPRLLARTGVELADIDLVEIHEAFGGQVACNLKAWKEGWKEPAIGAVDPERLNILGGSIAIGHPFAATGIRIATTLANEMHRRQARYGLISICAAGGQAGAMLLERPDLAG